MPRRKLTRTFRLLGATLLLTPVLALVSGGNSFGQTETAPEPESVVAASGPCQGTPCALDMLTVPPAGIENPTVTMLIELDPFRISLDGQNLGEPMQWLKPDTDAADEGATIFGAVLSISDDGVGGGLACIFDESYHCESDEFLTYDSEIPLTEATFNRVAVLALKDAETVPGLTDGPARLVATSNAFTPPLAPAFKNVPSDSSGADGDDGAADSDEAMDKDAAEKDAAEEIADDDKSVVDEENARTGIFIEDKDLPWIWFVCAIAVIAMGIMAYKLWIAKPEPPSTDT